MEHYRAVSWWIKWRDLNWPSPDNYETICRRADLMAENKVNCAIVFGAHFRWDYLPYWTILHDYLATVADELHKRNIRLFDHHSAVLVHRYDTREEMRNVMLHSGPHLPFSPDRQAAASWEFNGHRLNDWRMINVRTREILYLPQYTAEEFCFNNPDFIDSYLIYVKRLLDDTGIDGLMCDDAAHFMGYRSCGCKFCRARFLELTGYELPEPLDGDFWGNWDNPHWIKWVDMRYDNNGRFLAMVRSVLPDDFPLMSCCSGSSKAFYNNSAVDARQYIRGCNLVHQELCGNTPPYMGDPALIQHSIGERLAGAAHHLSVAGEKGLECIGQGYGFTEPSAGIIWALNKTMGAGCWFSTLKDRLGLPEKILATLPEDSAPVRNVYRFEEEHPELFDTKAIGQFAVLFSYNTRNHTCFGNMVNGCERDFRETMETFFMNGLCPEVVFEIPLNAKQYPVLVIPSAARLSETEINALRTYAANGGVVIATGYFGFPGTGISFLNHCSQPFWEFKWMNEEILPVNVSPGWRELEPHIFWNPARLQDESAVASLLERVRAHLVLPQFEIHGADGFYILCHENGADRVLHFLAAEYEVEIDQKLDAMRYHRSRVNLITGVTPRNTGKKIMIKGNWTIEAYSPLTDMRPVMDNNEIVLPDNCAYLIVKLGWIEK